MTLSYRRLRLQKVDLPVILNLLASNIIRSAMDYSNDLAFIQQSAAATADYESRREACLNFVAAVDGERILEVGGGSGLFVRRLAGAVSKTGIVHGVDLSDQQIAVARANCTGLDQVRLDTGDVLNLPFEEKAFDAVVSIQTLEYVPDVENATQDLLRVVKPGGRFINFATNWGSVFWNSGKPDLIEAMLRAWDAHAPYPNLPAQLPRLLNHTGLVSDIEQKPHTILNTSYTDAAFSYWAAKLIAAFAVGRKLVSEDKATAWMNDLQAIDYAGEYHFCTTGVMTRATVNV